MKKVKILLLALIAVSLVSANSVAAPPYDDVSTFKPCATCNQSVTIQKDPYWDFTQVGKDALDAQYAIDDPLGSGVDDSATWTYNCHGYTFEGSSGWIGTAVNYKSTDLPTPGAGHSGCYYPHNSGTICIWGGGAVHSSEKGPGFELAGPLIQRYTGKLGMSVKADHTEKIYGFHGELWCSK